MKVCNSCKRQFVPSSNHKSCPSCRYRATVNVVCSICNKQIHSKRFKSCKSCTNQQRQDYGKGRYLKNGYVMVFQKGHPRASKNYVLEHILIMEEYLGRKLKPDENIHHRNGVKNDNSLSNLELWVKPQPAGITAKDAYAWARVIIERYQNDIKKL
jgi:hypothetical protein